MLNVPDVFDLVVGGYGGGRRAESEDDAHGTISAMYCRVVAGAGGDVKVCF
jgi:hypothetical protein